MGSCAEVILRNRRLPEGTGREFLAELLGVFAACLCGFGATATVVLGSKQPDGIVASFIVASVWGIGCMIGVHVALGVSGAHLNSAFTLALAVNRGFPWAKLPFFLMAHVLGAFSAACVVYAVYYDLMYTYFDLKGRDLISASVFASYPAAGLSVVNACVAQVVPSLLLAVCFFALTDTRNTAPALGRRKHHLLPLQFGLCVTVVSLAFAGNTLGGVSFGFACNPAVDIAGRLFTLMAGWGTQPFLYENYFFVLPFGGPLVGFIIGAFLYDLLVSVHHPDHRRMSQYKALLNRADGSGYGDSFLGH